MTIDSINELRAAIDSSGKPHQHLTIGSDDGNAHVIFKEGPFWRIIIREYGRGDVYYDNIFAEFCVAAAKFLDIFLTDRF